MDVQTGWQRGARAVGDDGQSLPAVVVGGRVVVSEEDPGPGDPVGANARAMAWRAHRIREAAASGCSPNSRATRPAQPR
jgi:hypothetical protein